MLTVFRNALPDPLRAADIERGWDNADAGPGVVGDGPSALEGARSPLLDVPVRDLEGVDGACSPEDCRVFATGSAGRAILGGPPGVREDFGSAVVILRSWESYQAAALWRMNHTTIVLSPPREAKRLESRNDCLLC